jgi:hypothetical protein
MFPNLRLMIVAVLASVLGISCALGLFAEFRVSHDSFLRESNAGTPLQLSSSDAVPGRVVNTAAPFEFRFQAPPPPAGFQAAARSETADHATVVETPYPAPQPATAPTSAVPVNAPETTPDVTSGTVTSGAEPAAMAATGAIAERNGQEEAPKNSQQDAKPPPEGDVAARSLEVSPSAKTAEAPSPAATDSIADQNSRQEAPANSQENSKPKADGDLAARTPATSPPVRGTLPKAEIAPLRARAAAPDKRRQTAIRHWPIILRRAPRTRPASPIQDFTAVQQPFQWTPQPAPQPARRRVIRRLHPARKPVAQSATPQTTVSNTQPLDTPE